MNIAEISTSELYEHYLLNKKPKTLNTFRSIFFTIGNHFGTPCTCLDYSHVFRSRHFRWISNEITLINTAFSNDVYDRIERLMRSIIRYQYLADNVEKFL